MQRIGETRTVEKEPISLVIALTRTSALSDGATKRDTQERFHGRCLQLAEFYMKREHRPKHQGCDCSPIILPVVWAGVSSNSHLSIAPIAEIRDLRKQLQSAKGHAMICLAGADGFNTNVGSYLEFFEPLLTKQLTISLFVFEGNNAYATLQMARLLETIKYMKLGEIIDSTRAAIRRSQAPPPPQNDLLQLELEKASDGAFICPEDGCSYQGKTVDFVISHIVERIIRYKLNCPLCPESKSFDVLLPACNQHVRDHICRHLTAQVQRHSTAEPKNKNLETVNQEIDLESLRCGRCPGKLFETQKKLKIHWRDNHSPKNVQCDCCGEFVISRRYAQHVSRCKGRESPMVECPLCKTVVRKSYLPQHLYKEQESRGILDFAAQAKILVEGNLMDFFFQTMSTPNLHQKLAVVGDSQDLQTPDEPNITNAATPTSTLPPSRLDLEARPPMSTFATPSSLPQDFHPPTSTQRKTKPSKRTRELSIAGRDPKQRKLI